MKDKAVPNNSQVTFKKTEVKDHDRISSNCNSNKTKSVTACNDSLKSRTSNINVVCATYGKCVFNSNHDACVSKFIHDVNARTKKPKVVHIGTRKPQSQANKSVATPPKKIIASESSIQKSKSYYRMLYEKTSTVYFGNDQFALILRYRDLVQGNITINMVYYVEGLNHNLFSVGQFCNADLEVAFWKSTCFVRDLQGNDLLTGNRESDLYIISLQETNSSTLICFMAKASPTQAWLWHRTLSHLKFNYINFISKKDIMIGLPKLKYVKDQLCSSCELSKAKRSSFKTKVVPSSKGRLNLLHMDLCSPMRVESINGKKYILNDVIERRNRTLVEAARTMLSSSKLPLFFWVEAIATTCYTQNRSIIILTHEETSYHIINGRKPSIKHLHIFGCICYITRDGKNLNKMKEKGDPCIMVGYSTLSKGYRASDYDNSGPAPQLQNVSPSADKTGPSQQELDLLFGPLYDEFFTTSTSSVNKSSSPTDNSTQQDTPPTTSIQPTTEPITPTINVNAEENNNDQATDANIDENNIRVILFSIHSEDGNPSRAITNQALRWYKRRCCSLIPAESDSLPHAHAQTTKT
ncbi:retrovirus-related pol polyprotein from transposon TNT 1-94 [Tanacetum coccineum]